MSRRPTDNDYPNAESLVDLSDILGAHLNPHVVEWIEAALELRISPNGSDGSEAVDLVVELVRSFAEERSRSIVTERRSKWVETE
jgi:hypothetical protein